MSFEKAKNFATSENALLGQTTNFFQKVGQRSDFYRSLTISGSSTKLESTYRRP